MMAIKILKELVRSTVINELIAILMICVMNYKGKVLKIVTV